MRPTTLRGSGRLDAWPTTSYTGGVAGSFGSRVASVALFAGLVSIALPAVAVDAGAGSGGAASEEQGPPGEAPTEPVEAQPEDTAEETAPAEEGPPAPAEGETEENGESEEAPAESRRAPRPPLPEPPPTPEGRDPLAAGEEAPRQHDEGAPRGDFLRRLRSTAENIERIRASERTEVRTEDGVTTLSNVEGPPAEAAPRAAPEAVDETTRVEVTRTEAVGEAPGETTRQVTLASATATRRRDDDGHWHWLWVLGGVATVLLVPIALLLTRATRNG